MNKMINEKFTKETFYGLIASGMLKEAINYLDNSIKRNNETDKKLINLKKRYTRVFINNNYYIANKNKNEEFINKLLLIYAQYYHMVFYYNDDHSESILLHNLKEFIKYEFDNNNDYSCIEECEKILEDELIKKDFYFISGKVNGYYGPYIFRINNTINKYISLYKNDISLNISFISDFLSKGWIDYLTFGKLKLNYMLGETNKVFISNKFLRNKIENIDKPKCSSLLIYLGELISTCTKYKFISVKDVEYRSKLVEVISYKSFKTFKDVFSLASNNQYNDLKYACYKIISGLSMSIFGKEYESDFDLWKKKKKLIIKESKLLYDKHQELINSSKYEYISII